jgi:putative ABC transport system permease protein
MEQLFAAESDEEIAELLATPGMLPEYPLTISGVGWFPDAFVNDGGFENPSVHITAALFEEMGRPSLGYGGWFVRLTDPAELDRFRAMIDGAAPDETIVFQTVDNISAKAERGTRPPATALAIFAGVVGLIGLLLVGQAISRWTIGRARESDLLDALGATRATRFASGLLVVGSAIVVGVLVGAVAAVLASPLAPIGPARRAEVEPGMHVHAVTLLLGSSVVAVALIAAAAWPLWRGAQASRRRSARRDRPIALLRSAWAPMTVATGARFALERDHGRRSMSAGASIAGACTAIVVAVAAMVLTASIDHVVDTPRLYGQDWTHTITFSGTDDLEQDEVDLERLQAIVRGTPGIRRASLVAAMEVDLDGRRTPAVSIAGGDAPIEPTIADGRAPQRYDEVALGGTTMERLGVGVGDGLTMTTNTLDEQEVTVVGRAVLPAVGSYSGSDKTSLGEGALVHGDAVDYFSAGTAIVTELDPGADPADVREALAAQIGLPVSVHVEEASVPSEIVNLTALRSIPQGVAWALGLLVAIPLVHVLVVSARARRYDLATLAALGAERRTIRWIRVWQAWTIVAGALVIGVPLGALAGRWVWRVLAERFGTIPEPALYLVPLAALCAIVLAVAAAAAVLTGRHRHRAATLRALRSE